MYFLSEKKKFYLTSVSRACFLSLTGPALVNRAPVLAPYVQQGLEQQARDLRSIKFETYRKTLQKAWRGTLGRNAASYSLMQIKYHSLTALYIWMRPGAGFWNSGFLLLLKKTGIWTGFGVILEKRVTITNQVSTYYISKYLLLNAKPMCLDGII